MKTSDLSMKHDQVSTTSSNLKDIQSLSTEQQLIPAVEVEEKTASKTEVVEIVGNPDGAVSAKVEGTIGGKRGHIARRIWHLVMFGVTPILFYILEDLAEAWNTTCVRIISVTTMIIITVEALRLKYGIAVFAMRTYEKKVISAMFWGTFGVCLIMLAAPYRPGVDPATFEDKVWIGAPIIWSLGVVDPLIGELKHRNWSLLNRSCIGASVALVIFVISYFAVDTPWWFSLLYPEMIVLAEYGGGVLRIDDNGLMLLLPLLMTYVFLPWL